MWHVLKHLPQNLAMFPETNIDNLNLTTDEYEQLVQMAMVQNISLEELVAAAVKKFLAENPRNDPIPPPILFNK